MPLLYTASPLPREVVRPSHSLKPFDSPSMDSVMASPSIPMDVADINVCLLSAKKKSASSPSLRDLERMALRCVCVCV